MNRRDVAPQLFLLIILLCFAMALGGLFYEVWHG